MLAVFLIPWPCYAQDVGLDQVCVSLNLHAEAGMVLAMAVTLERRYLPAEHQNAYKAVVTSLV